MLFLFVFSLTEFFRLTHTHSVQAANYQLVYKSVPSIRNRVANGDPH